MNELSSIPRNFVHDLFSVHRERFDVTAGIRGALAFLVPLAVGLLSGYDVAGVLAALGTLNLVITEAPRPGSTELRVLAVAVPLSAVGFGVGTAIVELPEALELVVLASAIFLVLYLLRSARWQAVALTTAIMLVIGVGLAPSRLPFFGAGALLIALGAGWGLLAIVVSRRLGFDAAPHTQAAPGSIPPASTPTTDLTPAHALVVGVTVALGLGIGLALGFPRDFWIMLTVLVALRPDLASTTSYTGMRIVGTIAGACLAFVATVFVSIPVALFAIIAGAALLTFASRSVNYAFFAVWVTLLVITLLDLVYAGGPTLALVRIVDTLIGGALALAAALLLMMAHYRRSAPSALRAS